MSDHFNNDFLNPLRRRPSSEFDEHFRIVITAPDKDMSLQEDDIAFMLVQYDDDDKEKAE